MNLTKPVATLVFISLAAISANTVASDMTEREQQAKQVSADFIKQLGGQLQTAMKSGGPVAAIRVCRDVAPAIANDLSLTNGWRVTRVSNKVRNSNLGTPDAWEQAQLDKFESRKARGEKPADMIASEITSEGGKKYYRFMKPIGTKPVCLACHGADDAISPDVKAQLDTYYPHDKARGYKPGDIRGAVSIKQPLK